MKDKKITNLVEEIKEDFRNRQNARKSIETQWQMNMNFYMGNQFCSIGYGGEIEDADKQYFWQEREVFNHIAPVIEVRMAKLVKIKPQLTVIPSTSDDADIKTAKVSRKIIKSVINKVNLNAKISEATKWSEICGTAFYKVSWNGDIGQVVAINDNGASLRTGDIEVSVCSPFEIFPDSNTCENIDNCQSIIHAKVYGQDEVKTLYGLDVKGENLNVYGFSEVTGVGGLGYNGLGTKMAESQRPNSVLVIEKYQRPSAEYPKGRLVVIAGDSLVFDGELPYVNGDDDKRIFPFIKQVAMEQAGSFWGVSIIDRLIPVQRSYNAVKNRKHEFLNRISMRVMKVEDGSVDIENLEDEGLCPGKILVYRQGATPPSYLDEEGLPKGFDEEEDKLIKEFKDISGVTEVMDSDYVSNNLSATALEIMVQEDELRLNTTIDNIKNCIKKIGQQTLRLYKQFASLIRFAKIVGENGEVDVFYFSKNDISSDDIDFEADSEVGETLTQRRQMIFELLKAGILNNENGELSSRAKSKILENLGFGLWENSQDLNELHIGKAERENLKMVNGESVTRSEIDNDELHINEHVSFILSGDFDKNPNKEKLEEMFLNHIKEHQQNKREE